MTHPAVVVMVRNAFRPERDRESVPVLESVTIRGWLDGRGIAEFTQPTICLVNGRAVLRAEWSMLVIRSGDVVCFVALPHGGGGGGGGGGKNPLKTVLMVAVMVAGMALGAAYGGALAGAFGFEGGAFGSVTWGQIFGGVISGAVNMVGGALVNALVPAPSPSRPSADWGLGSIGSPPTPSPTYSLQSQGNQARLGQPIPVIYGRHLIYPDLAAEPWYEYQANEQYLHQLHVIGQGDHQIEAIRIEDTDIGNFAEVQYEIIEPGGAVTLFDPGVTTAPEVAGQELTAPNDLGAGETGWIGPFVSASAETTAIHIGVDIVFARGLYYANNSGGLDAKTISWAVEGRAIDNDGLAVGDWLLLASESHSAATNTPIRISYKYAVASGRYEVRLKRADDKDASSRAGHEIRWAGLRAWLQDLPDYGQATLLAIRMRATDNLSQRTSRMVNGIVTRKLPIWSAANGWSAPTPTRSIAWAFADACRATYGAGLADARIDLAGLLVLDALWEQRGDHFDGVFDASMTVWEALTRIARCGRAVPIQQGGVVRIVRDSPQSLPVALFGPRNIAKGSFRIRYIMPGEETADAVTVEFFSAVTWRPDEVTAKLPDSAEEKPARLQLTGCTDKDHAGREGLYMAAANRYRRKLITFQTELEGLIPTYGDLIAIVHDMPRWGQGGEIVGWDGVTLVASEPLEWAEGPHYIALRRADGSIAGPYPVLQGEAADAATPQAPLDIEPYLGGEAERTHYAFGPSDAWSLFARVLAIRPRGERVEIAAVGEHDAVHVN